MSAHASDPQPPSALTTRWSMLDRLGQHRADEAWAWFVTRYRPSIRAILARQIGFAQVDAALDEFWSYLFTHKIAARADRARRFRTFLCAVARKYALVWRREQAGLPSADDAPEPTCEDAAADADDVRAWALHTLSLGLAALRERHADDADLLQWFYGVAVDGSEVEPLTVAVIATRTSKKPNAIHVALHRARQRLRAHVEAELREVVVDVEGFEDERRVILTAIGAARPGMIL